MDDMLDYLILFKEQSRRKWLKLKNMIKEINMMISLKFYANVFSCPIGQPILFVLKKHLNLSMGIIKLRFRLTLTDVCSVESTTLPRNRLSDEEWDSMLQELCRKSARWYQKPR